MSRNISYEEKYQNKGQKKKEPDSDSEKGQEDDGYCEECHGNPKHKPDHKHDCDCNDCCERGKRGKRGRRGRTGPTGPTGQTGPTGPPGAFFSSTRIPNAWTRAVDHR